MLYFPPDRPVPDGLQTPRLLLEPLHPRHVALDYDAVMESRAQLRLWSGSPWPADAFTLAENLQDLEFHWREQQERLAFTYTVLDPARQACLGCVYMRPLSELAAQNPDELAGVAADETHIRFWVRSSRLASGLDHHLLSALLGWLETDWFYSRALFGTREANAQQVQMLDGSPLHRALKLRLSQRGGTHIFYEA